MGRSALILLAALLSGCWFPLPDKQPSNDSLAEDESLDTTPDPDTVSPDVEDSIEDPDTDEWVEPPQDSDGDNISDEDEGRWATEGAVDSDCDFTPDYLDDDSDGDTIDDGMEAGDTDIWTSPVDSDSDLVPDFQDTDSDDDWLPDSQELASGADRTLADTDSDGVPDGIEVAAGTDPDDIATWPSKREIVYTSAYNQNAVAHYPFAERVYFDTTVDSVDVLFALSVTGTMSGELENLKTAITDTYAEIFTALGPPPQVRVGLGTMAGCPSGCLPSMKMDSILDGTAPNIGNAIYWITAVSPCTDRTPYTQFLQAAVTGDLSPYADPWGTGTTESCPEDDMFGWACFRPGAARVIVQFGDLPFDGATTTCSPAVDIPTVIATLNGARIKYVGVDSGDAQDGMTAIAEGTNSRDVLDAPLVYEIASDGTGLGSQAATAVMTLVDEYAHASLTLELRDDPGDSVDAVATFIEETYPEDSTPWTDPETTTETCSTTLTVSDLYGDDGIADSFSAVPAGVLACFDLVAKRNTVVTPESEMQVFSLDIDVLDDQGVVWDTVGAHFFVPPPPITACSI